MVGVLDTSSMATVEKKIPTEIPEKPYFKVETANNLKQTIITPHLEQRIVTGFNILWCNTFQLAWNKLCDLSGGTVQMESAPPVVSILNKRTASKGDLDENCYVAVAGLTNAGIYDRIRKELATKFKENVNSNLLGSPPHKDWVVYAFLFKKLPFRWAFSRFHKNLKFQGYDADSFGINQFLDIQKDEVKMASQVIVLDHKNNNDVIIELKTKAIDERLILAKIQPQKSLGATIANVEKRIAEATPSQMHDKEHLLVPVLNFEIFRQYSELYNHPICSLNKILDGKTIEFAAQTIRFRLDERGAVLKSEINIALGLTQRSLVFDKPFLILLKRHKAKNPYFALWVGNAELLMATESR